VHFDISKGAPPVSRSNPSLNLAAAGRTTEIRVAGFCALLAFLTFNVGWIAGDLAQPQAFSPLHNDISDLGAATATSPWLYNQLAANLSGLLLIGLGIGVWRSITPSRRGWVGSLGAIAVIVIGAGIFLDGVFRLDCQAIDNGCTNASWHSHAHKVESGITVGAILLALLVLPFVLRRITGRRAHWLPMLAALPALFAANVAFSPLGEGAATRAGTVAAFSALAYLGYRLVREQSYADREFLTGQHARCRCSMFGE
jgi:Protein of unknown function (DUF998)